MRIVDEDVRALFGVSLLELVLLRFDPIAMIDPDRRLLGEIHVDDIDSLSFFMLASGISILDMLSLREFDEGDVYSSGLIVTEKGSPLLESSSVSSLISRRLRPRSAEPNMELCLRVLRGRDTALPRPRLPSLYGVCFRLRLGS